MSYLRKRNLYSRLKDKAPFATIWEKSSVHVICTKVDVSVFRNKFFILGSYVHSRTLPFIRYRPSQNALTSGRKYSLRKILDLDASPRSAPLSLFFNFQAPCCVLPRERTAQWCLSTQCFQGRVRDDKHRDHRPWYPLPARGQFFNDIANTMLGRPGTPLISRFYFLLHC